MAPAHHTNVELSIQIERFFAIGRELHSLFERSGIESHVCRSSDLPGFRSLDTDSRDRVLRMMKLMLENGLAMELNRESLSRNRTLAWRVMSAMGFKPVSDAFDLIAETDVIEIYGADGKVAFATPAYFDLTSYSMDDLYCRPWTDLWGRDPAITARLMEKVMQTIDPKNEKTIMLDIPEHEVWETSSYEKRHAVVRPKLFSPMKDRFGQRGFISVNSFVGFLN